MKVWMQAASFVVLLGVSTVLGVLGQPTEMGIAVTAGVLGLVFSNLDKIARFKGAGFEAEMRERIETVVEKEIEPDVSLKLSGPRMEGYGLVGDDPPKVIRALLDTTYTWRYVSGISEQSGVPPEKVRNTLDLLKKNGLARSSRGETGPIWALTAKGREVFAGLRS
jgi:hypothetical protein